MGQIRYMAPIKSVSEKLSKSDKVIYMVRTAPTSNEKMLANPYYSSICGKRSTEYSAAEKAAQLRFGKICKATQTRLADPSKKQADVAAFKAQTQYKTLRQYVWHKCSEEID